VEPGPADHEQRRTPGGASGPALFALALLVLLVSLSPWPAGSAHPLAVAVVTRAALVGALVVAAVATARGAVELPRVALWPLLGVAALGALQCLPLPGAVHRVLAPGSWAVWHPIEPAAAAVLGQGPSPVSVHPTATARSLALFVGVALLALLAAPALRDRRWATRAAAVVVAGGVAVGLYGIVARVLFGPLLFGRFPVPTVSPFGPFVSKNHFAGYVAMAALLGLGLATGLAEEARGRRGLLGWIESRRAARVVAVYGAVAVMGLAVLVSLSRGGALSLLAGGLAFALLRARSRAGARPIVAWGVGAAVGGAFLVGIALLPAGARERLATVGAPGEDRSASYRLAVWRDSVGLAATSPLVGIGLGAYADALPRFKKGAGELRVEHAENEYLELLAEVGALGLGLAVLVLAANGRGALRGVERRHDRVLRGIWGGALAGAVAFLVHGLIDFSLRVPSNALLFAFLLSVLTGVGREVSPVPRPAAGGLVVALGAALSVSVAVGPAERRGPAEAHPRLLVAGPTPLRARALEASLVERVRRRPAEAESWLFLAWLRAVRGDPAGAASLARHAVSLDPRRTALREAAARYGASAPRGDH